MDDPLADSSIELERRRQAALDALSLTDSLSEPAYDAVVQLARIVCDTPIALISLIDRDRQWFKARVGLDVTETPRNIAFCDHAIRTSSQMMEVEDAQLDLRFKDNPLVTGEPNIRFYAGQPLVDGFGNALGTVCVIDRVPRKLSPTQYVALSSLAEIVAALVEARRVAALFARSGADAEVAAG